MKDDSTKFRLHGYWLLKFYKQVLREQIFIIRSCLWCRNFAIKISHNARAARCGRFTRFARFVIFATLMRLAEYVILARFARPAECVKIARFLPNFKSERELP